jgi:hypothetical protein
MYLHRPTLNIIDNPPAAARVSVHPGYGSAAAAIIIAGLKISKGMSPLCFYRDLSERFLVKV